jgi:hypothetical protein
MSNVPLHIVGALNIPAGNVAMILLGLVIWRDRPGMAKFSVVAGVVGLLGMLAGPFLVILTGHGGGLAERVALYPLIIWLIAFGLASIQSARAILGTRRRRLTLSRLDREYPWATFPRRRSATRLRYLRPHRTPLDCLTVPRLMRSVICFATLGRTMSSSRGTRLLGAGERGGVLDVHDRGRGPIRKLLNKSRT